MSVDFSYVIKAIPKVFQLFPFTVYVILVAAIVSFILAVPVTAIRIHKVPVLSQICNIWLSFIRSMPGILELFLVYFGLPRLLRAVGIDTSSWPATTFVLIALIWHYVPFLSEVLRPSYLSVDRGQHEAADCMGLCGIKKVIRITGPQTLPVALPQLGNALIDLVKDTSLLFTIGVTDIIGKAKIIISANSGLHKLEVYIAAAVAYWVITVIAVGFIKILENHFKKYKISSMEAKS